MLRDLYIMRSNDRCCRKGIIILLHKRLSLNIEFGPNTEMTRDKQDALAIKIEPSGYYP